MLVLLSEKSGLIHVRWVDAHLLHLAHQGGHVDAGGTGVVGANLERTVIGDHFGEDVEDWLLRGSVRQSRVGLESEHSYLGDSLVVDVDQVTRGGVDLESFVEAEGGLESLGGVGGEGLTDLNLLEEVGLLLLRVVGEALGLGFVYGEVDGLLLGLGIDEGLLLCAASLAAVVAAQFPPELGAAAATVVEVDGVGCEEGS